MKFIAKALKFLVFLGILGALTGAGGVVYLYKKLEPELPSTESLRDVRLQVPLRVYSRDGRLMAEYGEKKRIPLTYAEIPERVRQAFLAAEDDRFFEHPGVDYQGLVRAAVQLVLTGKRRQGGSTITMQVARNFFLSREKTYKRKLKEILLALRIEKEMSKEEILTLYLNKIYLGNRAYGIGAAAAIYYGRGVAELELPQIAMIAGLPKAPSTSNPIANPEKAKNRRHYVLERMRQLGFLDTAAYTAADAAPLSARLHQAAVELDAPYPAEMARSEAVERFGDEAYTRGITINTSIDSRLQSAATSALRNTLQDYDKRHGYRGAAAHKAVAGTPVAPQDWVEAIPSVADLRRALVLSLDEKTATVLDEHGEELTLEWRGLSWARHYASENRRGPSLKQASDALQVGDLIYLRQDKDDKGETYWRLAQPPAVEGALVSVDPSDGAIRALVGGYDFYRSKFNRATQARRQPGSGFKAFIYSAALENGFTPATLVNDAPLVVHDASLEGAWKPENYSGKWFGPTRLRQALYKSRNLVSIRVLRAMGVKAALTHAQRFGFDTDKLPHNLSLALGSGEVTPIQMARGYAVLANGGYLVDPYLVERIEDGVDGVVFQAQPLRICETCPDEALAGQGDTGAETSALPDAPAAAEPAEPATATTTVAEALEPAAEHAPRVISRENQYMMTSMMMDVIKRGTATRARSLGRDDLAGKTGTTNDQRDAWFNGFNRSLVAVVWVGLDSYQPLGRGEVGGKAALPAWIEYMQTALEGVPERTWDMPEDIVTVRIDPNTGERASANDEKAIFEVFRKTDEPQFAAQTQRSQTHPNGNKTETLTQELF